MSENKWLICPNCDIIIENNYRQIICGECKNKFVPVVSLQALEKWIEKHRENRVIGYGEDEQIVLVNDLLSWVKKQGVEKR